MDPSPQRRTFLDLPPELRNYIYDLYLTHFGLRCLNHQSDPPLTLTCRTIRAESLPMLYGAKTLYLDVQSRERKGGKGCMLRLGKFSREKLRTLPIDKIRWIRKLEFFVPDEVLEQCLQVLAPSIAHKCEGLSWGGPGRAEGALRSGRS